MKSFTVALSSDFNAAFWECPSIALSEWKNKQFEFVVLNAPQLAGRVPDSDAFSDVFESLEGSDGQYAVRFLNFGKDSLFIAPRPMSRDEGSDSHVKRMCDVVSFMKHAKETEKLDFWAAVGDSLSLAVQQRASGQQLQPQKKIQVSKHNNAQLRGATVHAPRPSPKAPDVLPLDSEGRIWLSTSGLGVSWLHVRLDTTPKYYNYDMYK